MLERTIRAIAGTFILLSLILGHYVNPLWYLFTAFVGINLFQSAFTRWCLMEDLLKKFLFKNNSLDTMKVEPHERTHIAD